MFRRRRAEDDLDKEIQFHVDQSVRDLVATGLDVDEARRRTRLEFGGTLQVKEQVRDTGVLTVLDTFWADVRYAARALRRAPGFAVAAMLALALGQRRNDRAGDDSERSGAEASTTHTNW